MVMHSYHCVILFTKHTRIFTTKLTINSLFREIYIYIYIRFRYMCKKISKLIYFHRDTCRFIAGRTSVGGDKGASR